MTERLLRGGRVFDGERFLEADLRVGLDGKIQAVEPGLVAQAGEPVTNLDGRWLLPGLVDCHVHFRDPGLTRKEGYPAGSAGALHGGVTTVLEVQNNPPLLLDRDALDRKLDEYLPGRSRVDYGCYANLVEESVAALQEMAPRTPAFKCFFGGSTGMGGVQDERTLERWFAAAADAGRPVVAHCEDETMLRQLRQRHAGGRQPHHLMRPASAEVKSIETAIRLVEKTGAELHVFHLSTAGGASLVAEAAARGLPVSASVGPQYLLLTQEEVESVPENRLKINPSIKSTEDRDQLRAALESGSIAAIGTDHAPHPLEEKARPYAKAPSGFPSVDLLLPLLFEATSRSGGSLEVYLRAATSAPAALFGIPGKGRLAPGYDADLVVVNPTATRTVVETELPSRSKWSPFHGWELGGWPEQVFLRGVEVFADGASQGEPQGRSLF